MRNPQMIEPALVTSECVGPHTILQATGEFSGVKFYYDDVAVQEEGEEARLSFSYFVTQGTVAPEKLDEFRKYLGDNLLYLIEKQLENNEVVYGGGTGNWTYE